MSKIIIEPKTARLYRDLDTFSKMDPYVIVQCGEDKAKSKTHNGGGKNPTWNDALSIKANDESLTLTVWDKDIGFDDFVGSTSIDLNKIRMNGGVLKDWISIYHKGKEAGQVYCEITLTSKTSAYGGYGASSAGYAPTAYAPAPTAYSPAPTAYAPVPTATYYPTAPAPAPAPAGYYQSSPGVYAPAPAPAPAPAYQSAYPTTYPSSAPAQAPAPAYPAAHPSAYPPAPGAYYQAPPGGSGGYYSHQ